MGIDGIGGGSNVTGPLRPKAAPSERPEEPVARPKPQAAATDRTLFQAPGSTSELSLDDVMAKPRFDVSEASERLIAAHGGDLEQAYFESLDIRNTKKDAGYGDKLAAYSQKLGYKRNLTPDELRDVEHFMFAAASVAEKGQVPKNADFVDRATAVLKREPQAVAMGVLTLGYSAAKAVNSVLPQDLKFLKSRTAPSLDEVEAGLKGAMRGLKDKI